MILFIQLITLFTIAALPFSNDAHELQTRTASGEIEGAISSGTSLLGSNGKYSWTVSTAQKTVTSSQRTWADYWKLPWFPKRDSPQRTWSDYWKLPWLPKRDSNVSPEITSGKIISKPAKKRIPPKQTAKVSPDNSKQTIANDNSDQISKKVAEPLTKVVDHQLQVVTDLTPSVKNSQSEELGSTLITREKQAEIWAKFLSDGLAKRKWKAAGNGEITTEEKSAISTTGGGTSLSSGKINAKSADASIQGSPISAGTSSANSVGGDGPLLSLSGISNANSLGGDGSLLFLSSTSNANSAGRSLQGSQISLGTSKANSVDGDGSLLSGTSNANGAGAGEDTSLLSGKAVDSGTDGYFRNTNLGTLGKYDLVKAGEERNNIFPGLAIVGGATALAVTGLGITAGVLSTTSST